MKYNDLFFEMFPCIIFLILKIVLISLLVLYNNDEGFYREINMAVLLYS